MANELTLHQVYMGLVFRPLVMPDGSVKRVGVQASSPACVDPECYPNLITAAPTMYQLLAMLRVHVHNHADLVDAIENVLAFAQNGYLHTADVDAMIRKVRIRK